MKNKNKIMKSLGYAAATVGLIFIAMEPAMAQVGLNKITTNVKDQMPGIADVLSAVAYVAGVGFGIKSALKLKEHNESKGQVPLSQPITLAIVAALLLALPALLSTGKEAVFGAGSTGTTLDGTTIRTIR